MDKNGEDVVVTPGARVVLLFGFGVVRSGGKNGGNVGGGVPGVVLGLIGVVDGAKVVVLMEGLGGKLRHAENIKK